MEPTTTPTGATLVRDNTPAWQERTGDTRPLRTAEPYERRGLLLRKLREEADEFIESPSVEEAGDVLDILHALCDEFNLSWGEIAHSRKQKHAERGGFTQGYVLYDREGK